MKDGQLGCAVVQICLFSRIRSKGRIRLHVDSGISVIELGQVFAGTFILPAVTWPAKKEKGQALFQEYTAENLILCARHQ